MTDGTVIDPITNPGTRIVARYSTRILIIHANMPNVIILIGKRRILRNGFTITMRMVSTIPVVISTPTLANCTCGNAFEMRYNVTAVLMIVLRNHFMQSFYHSSSTSTAMLLLRKTMRLISNSS